jgi:hypothetical protein
MKAHSRDSILRKLGLTEEDVRDSEKLFQQMPPPPPQSPKTCLKEERLLGYTMLRLKRSKALRVLGTSEEEVDIENTKNLGSLGRSGRRRSFLIEIKDMPKPKGINHFDLFSPRIKGKRRRLSKRNSCFRSCGRYREKSVRRKSTGDLLSLKIAVNDVKNLKKQNEDANAEIALLRQRLERLEKEFSSQIR